MADLAPLTAPRTIGFIGLGLMGRPMTANLIKAGYSVRGFDVSEQARRDFEAANGVPAMVSAVEACRDVAAVITMLPDGKVVRQALLGGNAGGPAIAAAGAGTIVIDMSSASPVDTRALAIDLKAWPVTFMDAAVSGTVAGATAATLTIMCGGDAALIARVTPLLEAMGKRIVHAGALGAGHAVKALNNFMVATQFVIGLEAIMIGEKFGLDPNLLVDIFNMSTSKNLVTEGVLKQQIISRKFSAGFWLRLMAKDIGNAAEIARHVGVNAETALAGAKLWADARDQSAPQADFTELFKYLEQRYAAGKT